MKLDRFNPPANINDFPSDPAKAEKLRGDWSQNIGRWTTTAIIGDPWDLQYDKDRTIYYNPVTTDMPEGVLDTPITWNAFPNRIRHTFPSVADPMEYYRMADQGVPDPTYTPTGDRGWQDEYCEWSVTRNADGKMVRVDFTCENAEYWFTLWRVDPERVRQLYQDIVGQPVSLDDLTIKAGGNTIYDPSTGQPAYEPLNKWNNSTSRGVVHLISSPNTLGAEIYLAAAATLQRACPDCNPDELIRCAKYGREFRNSDPNIGAAVNGLVHSGYEGKHVQITLTDPVGLYMRWPPTYNNIQFSDPTAPDVDFARCWSIFRDSQGVLRGDPAAKKAVHLRFELPPDVAAQGYTLEDLVVTTPGHALDLRYGSQLAENITMMLIGHVVTPAGQPPPPVFPCVEDSPTPKPMVEAFLPFAIYFSQFENHTLQVALTPRIAQGSRLMFLLQSENLVKGATLRFSNEGIKAETSYDSNHWREEKASDPPHWTTSWFIVPVTVATDAPLGDVSLQLINPDGTCGPPMPSVLEVVPAGSIGAQRETSAMDDSDAVKQAFAAARLTTKRRPHLR